MAAANRFEEALACLSEIGGPDARRSSVRYWDTEVLRLEAVLRHRLGQPAEAQGALERGLGIARDLGCPMPGLRAAASLADLHAAQGRTGEAHRILSTALSALPPSAAGRDVESARRRVERLADRG